MPDLNPIYTAHEALPARGPQTPPDFNTDTGQPGDLATMTRKLWCRRWIIVAVVGAALAATFLAVKTMTPLYTATVEILIGAPVSDGSPNQPATSRPSVDSEVVQSQARIIRSRIIARRVVERLALDEDPEFNPYLKKAASASSSLFGGNAERGNNPVTVPRKEQVELVADILLTKTAAEPTDRSHVLNVQVEAEDPVRAAQIANAFANVYVEQTLVHQTELSQSANTWLRGQITQLRQQVDEDERAVEEYRKKHGLYESPAATVSTQQMGELNTQLIIAESAKAEAGARLAQAESVLKSGGELDSIPEVVESPLIHALSEKEAEIERQVAEMSATYGPMHPRIQNIKAQQDEIRSKIRGEVQKIVSSVRNAARTSEARYNALKLSLENAKSEVGRSNVDSVELRQLEREAQASRTLFENFLERYKRNSAHEEFKQTNAWIISPASVPLRPSFPPTKPILAGVTLAAALLGALLVLFLEALDRTFRTSDEVYETTGLPTLALIPTFKKSEIAGNRAYDPASPVSESIHKLHMRLLFSHAPEPPKAVMFTSSAPGEGKSRTSILLARQLAYAGRRVILLDGDLRRPSIHALLDEKNGPGLIDLLNGDTTPDEAVYRDPKSGVHAIFAGRSPAGDNRLPDVHRLRMLLATLSKHYDTVILDAPPVLVGAEVIHYAQLVDATVFVAKWGATKREVVLDGLHQLMASNARIAGVVLSQVNPKQYKRYAAVDLHYRYPPRRGLARRTA